MANWEYPLTVSTGTIEAYLQDVANDAITKSNSAYTELMNFNLPDDPQMESISDLNGDISLPTIPDAPNVTVQDLAGTRPNEPTLTMSLVATDAIISAMISTLKTELEARIAGSSTIENAIFQRDKDRISSDAGYAYDKTLKEFAASGFSRPTGAQLSTLEGFTKEAIEKLSEASRNASITMYQVTEKAIDQLTALEANLIGAKAGDEGNKIRLYESGTDAYINLMKLGYQLAQIQVDLYRSQVEAFSATARAKADEINLLIAKANAINEANAKVFQLAIAKIQAVSEKAKSAGSIMGQLAATAMNGINFSTSFSYSQSKSEAHSFEG